MIKELVITVVIIISIIMGDFLTQKYTKESVQETTENLKSLREEIMIEEDNIDSEQVKNIIKDIHEKWDERQEKLAYYIEHDELEKVKTELTSLRGYLDKEEYLEAVPETDKSIYLLEHIKDKNAFNLKNIF